MELNKEEFLKTEFGTELKNCVMMIDYYHYSFKNRKEEAWWRAQWFVYEGALKHFYGIEYYYICTDKYFGAATADRKDWLFKIKRNEVKSRPYKRQRQRHLYCLWKCYFTKDIIRDTMEIATGIMKRNILSCCSSKKRRP